MSIVTRLHIVLDDALHRKVKSAAALHGETLQAYVARVLEIAVDREKAKKGSK